MREWAISKTYKIMDYIFAIGVAKDNPHVLGIFTSPINAWKMSLIYEFSYKEESEIDNFATVTFPLIASNYIIEEKRSHNRNFDSPAIKFHIENQMYKEKIKQLLDETEEFYEGATPQQIAKSVGITVQKTIALLRILEQEKKVIRFREYNQNYFKTP